MHGGRIIVEIIVAVGIGALSFVLGYLFNKVSEKRERASARKEADKILAESKAKAKDIVLAAKDEAFRIKDAAEKEIERRRRDLQRQEERIQRRLENLDKKLERLDNKEKKINQLQSKLEKEAAEAEELLKQRKEELEKISGLSSEEAKQLLLEEVARESRQDMARVIREVEAQAEAEANRRASKIIATVIERIASDYVSESTVSTVPLPNDEMKGRIIGRQGRNIRAIEEATGVDLIVDDTPEAITISSFDPVRREVARIALSRLVQDGRIHPARIEKEVKRAKSEVEATIIEAGENALVELGIQRLHPEIVKLLGRLKYRTSYGQNQLAHSIETGYIAGMLAAELGANVKVAKMGGLLHDIGKAVSHENDGPHAKVGAEIARRYKVPEPVVHCIEAHHHEVEPQTLEAVIVAAADAISGARPGARRESLESYIKRITALEEIAKSFRGVQEAFAIQAGRELRIIVKPDKIDDYGIIQLSKEIASKVEENLEYPGQIKVMVIRESRAVEFAK